MKPSMRYKSLSQKEIEERVLYKLKNYYKMVNDELQQKEKKKSNILETEVT